MAKIEDAKDEEKLITHIRNVLKTLRYGYVQITVQDSKIVQIEKVEKFRLNQALNQKT